MYPVRANFNDQGPLAGISADWLNTVANMLSGLQIEMIAGQAHAEIVPPRQDGTGWKFRIPNDSVLPTTGAVKYQVLQIIDDTTTPPTPGWDWVRATA